MFARVNKQKYNFHNSLVKLAPKLTKFQHPKNKLDHAFDHKVGSKRIVTGPALNKG